MRVNYTISYTGPIIIPHQLLELKLSNAERLVAGVVFSLTDRGGLVASDKQMSEFLRLSMRTINSAKNTLLQREIILGSNPYFFNLQLFSNPDELTELLVATSSARQLKPEVNA